MNILIIGAPGSGKGTMSEKIVANYKLLHVSTGDMLRAAIKEESPVGLEAQSYMNAGKLVPDDVINKLIKERLNKDDALNGFLMDGFPRNLAQVKSFEAILNELGKKIDLVLNLEIDDLILEKRITGRRICPECGAIYHIETKKPKVDGICDNTGATLIQRKDDTVESLKTRLETYHTLTKPIIEYYKNLGILRNINADQTTDKVFEAIQKELKELI